MVKLVSAKCPSCNASLKISQGQETIECDYCQQTIIVEEAIGCYKLKISGTINIDGIETNIDLITAANELLDMQEFLKAKKKFLEFVEKCPNNYQGWLGLLICRTRNFTIKDKNILFENDINKYYEHFLSLAPEDIKNNYIETIENYLHPEKMEQKIKITNTKTKSSRKFKIDSKTKPYIAPIILIIMGVSLLSNSIFVGGILWCLSGIVLIPQIKEKIKFSNKKTIIFSVIFGIIGFFAFAIESPYSFVGTWATLDNEYSIKFKNDETFVIETKDGININGSYSHIYKNNYYILTIICDDDKFSQIKFRYSSDENSLEKLCVYKEEKCIKYLKKTSE